MNNQSFEYFSEYKIFLPIFSIVNQYPDIILVFFERLQSYLHNLPAPYLVPVNINLSFTARTYLCVTGIRQHFIEKSNNTIRNKVYEVW